jgi:hypothetical protein
LQSSSAEKEEKFVMKKAQAEANVSAQSEEVHVKEYEAGSRVKNE